MKILLINPPVRTWAEPNCFPLGLGYLASMLDINGYEVQVLDINAQRLSKAQVIQRLKSSKADVFGLTGLVTSAVYIKWLVEKIKAYHPSKKIMLGGPLANTAIGTINRMTDGMIDTLCVGEGEKSIVDVLYSYQEGRNEIRYIKAKKPIEPLDKIPFPLWERFPMDVYLKNPIGGININKWADGKAEGVPKSMNLIASRGCPYSCVYCSHDFAGYKYRHRSVDNIIEEMDSLYSNFGVHYFHFVDDEFVLDKNFVHTFCDEVMMRADEIDQSRGYTWGCTGNARIMDEDLLMHMSEAGCVHISYGIESGSQKMLDWMDKKITVEKAKESVILTEKYIQNASYTFIIGCPDETYDTIWDTIDFCKETHIQPEAVFFLTAYPGTKLYDYAVGTGHITDELGYLTELSNNEQGRKILRNFTKFTDEKLYELKDRITEEVREE